MIKIPLTFTGFDDEQVTENYYFHLSTGEVLEMEAQTPSLSDRLLATASASTGADVIGTFKILVEASYGERVPGSSSEFVKSEAITKKFTGSMAYDALILRLLTESDFAETFTNGLLPKELMKNPAIQAEMAKLNSGILQPMPEKNPSAYRPEDLAATGLGNPLNNDGHLVPWAYREPRELELVKMAPDQLMDVHRRHASGWTPAPPQ